MLAKFIKNKMIFPAMLLVISFSVKAEVIAFENVNIIPMDEERVLYNHRVITDGEKIAAVESMVQEASIKTDRKIDCHGKYMIPGLVDTHYHQSGSDPKEYDLLYKTLLANGITTVVSMGEMDGQDTIAIREHANKKENLAPIYYTVGPMLEPDKLKTPQDAIETVRFHKQRGYDFIKVHGNFSKETYLSLLNEAEKAHIRVIGHAQRLMPLEYTLRLAHVAHMEDILMVFSDDANFNVANISDKQAKNIAKQVKDSGAFVSPTLSILAMIQDYTDEKRFEKLKNRPENAYLLKSTFREYTAPNENYRAAIFLSPKGLAEVDKLVRNTKKLTHAFYKAGVPMLVGSDNFGMQIVGFSFHDEMEKMNNAGMPAYAVLNSATVMSARYLNRYPIAGTISVGKNAEFALLEENPLKDIKNARNVQGVMLKGQWFDKPVLEQFLADVRTARSLEK